MIIAEGITFRVQGSHMSPARHIYGVSYLFPQWFLCIEIISRSNFKSTASRQKFPTTIDLRPVIAWWRHQMETCSALLVLCVGNSPVTGDFPTQRPVTRSFDVFFDLRLNNGWANNRGAGDLRRYRAHYDITVMVFWVWIGLLAPISHIWYGIYRKEFQPKFVVGDQQEYYVLILLSNL